MRASACVHLDPEPQDDLERPQPVLDDGAPVFARFDADDERAAEAEEEHVGEGDACVAQLKRAASSKRVGEGDAARRAGQVARRDREPSI